MVVIWDMTDIWQNNILWSVKSLIMRDDFKTANRKLLKLIKLDKSTQEEKATGQLNKDNPSRVPL